jgi:hypothetical protein
MPSVTTVTTPAQNAGRIWMDWLAREKQDEPRTLTRRPIPRAAWSIDIGLYALALAAIHGDAPFRLSGRTAPTGGILPRYGHRYACAALGRMASLKIDASAVISLAKLGALEELPDPAPAPSRTLRACWARVAPELVWAWLDAGVLAEPGAAGYLPPSRLVVFADYGEMPYV